MIIFSSKTGGETVKARNWDLLGFFSPIPGMLQAGSRKEGHPRLSDTPRWYKNATTKKMMIDHETFMRPIFSQILVA